MKSQRGFRFALAIAAGVVSTAIYAGIVAFANEILNQDWPFTAWVVVVVTTLSMVGAIVLQYVTRKQLDVMLSKWDGLEEATGLCGFREKMEASNLYPAEQLHEIKFSFDFMGNGGSKWTRQEQGMREMLEQVGNAGNQARMLLLHPESEVCISASESRFYSKQTIPMRVIKSLKVLDRLRTEFPHLHFKLYDHTPYFRLTFVDGRAAIVGHYKEYRDESEHSPLMVLKADSSDWSFYHAFTKYFEAEWKEGDSITSEELKTLEERVKNNGA